MHLFPSKEFMNFKNGTAELDTHTDIVLATEQLENQPAAEPTNPTDQKSLFFKSDGCATVVDLETKTVKIWLFGVLRDTNNYKKAISIMYSLPEDFTVHIFIHSRGGSIQVGCNILTAMERCKATIITHNIGMAASCGSLILSFGDKIHVCPQAITMFHNAGFGNMDSVHRLLTQTTHTINSVMDLFERMKSRGVITEDEIEAIVKRGNEYYFTSEEMEKRLRESDRWYEGGI